MSDNVTAIRKMKYCPFMVSSITGLSCTVKGESYTNSYMERCIGEKCVAFRRSSNDKGFCARFDAEATYPVGIRIINNSNSE